MFPPSHYFPLLKRKQCVNCGNGRIVLEQDRAGQRELALASLVCNRDVVGAGAWGSCVWRGPDQPPGLWHISRKKEPYTNKQKSFTCGHLFRNTVRTQCVSPTWAPSLGRGHVLVKVGEGYDVNEKHLCVCSPRCCQLCLGC